MQMLLNLFFFCVKVYSTKLVFLCEVLGDILSHVSARVRRLMLKELLLCLHKSNLLGVVC